jgi:hypothetical protein
MRFVFRIDSRPTSSLPAAAPLAALLAALLFAVMPGAANAQASMDVATLEAAAGAAPGPDTTSADVLNVPADSAATSDYALDDQMLSRQRGGATGMVMVAATPQLMRGNGVTLWDEIAPPSPLPIPVDAARAAQGNVANYQRK